MDPAPDFDEFIACLTAHGVEFVIVGAYALAFHGAPRFTGDLDVLIRPTTANATRFLESLDSFGFGAQHARQGARRTSPISTRFRTAAADLVRRRHRHAVDDQRLACILARPQPQAQRFLHRSA